MLSCFKLRSVPWGLTISRTIHTPHKHTPHTPTFHFESRQATDTDISAIRTHKRHLRDQISRRLYRGSCNSLLASWWASMNEASAMRFNRSWTRVVTCYICIRTKQTRPYKNVFYSTAEQRKTTLWWLEEINNFAISFTWNMRKDNLDSISNATNT